MKPITDLQEIYRLSRDSIDKSPPCSALFGGMPVEYVPGESITHVFPVKEAFSNPTGSMQGGLITAAFDNVFGHLSYLLSGGAATLNISTTYHRPIYPGDELKITVRLKFMSKNIIYMEGEAFNKEGKLIASTTSEWMIINRNRLHE